KCSRQQYNQPQMWTLCRRRTALWSTVALLGLSAVVLVIGLLSDTRTATVHVSGYYPGIILVASIIFISLGVIACFLCAIVDGIIAAEFIDQRPLMEGRCKFYTSGTGYLYDNYQTEVMCQSYSQDCKMKVRSNSCYCCDLYTCDSSDYRPPYYAFTGVNSCWDVVHLYRLLWSNVVLNVLGVFLGIFTTAILGAFKDLVRPFAFHRENFVPFLNSVCFLLSWCKAHSLLISCHHCPPPPGSSHSEPDVSESSPSSSHPLQPHPAYDHLHGPLPFWPGPACLPQLPNAPAGNVGGRDPLEARNPWPEAARNTTFNRAFLSPPPAPQQLRRAHCPPVQPRGGRVVAAPR
uniref:Uncharacterized protein n=1 Tax=Electrophorus electricus TaxID=8005 RepID=A0A4W4FLJ7_ELEEL